MVGALHELAADPDLRRRLGRAARATLERAELTWEANARRVLSAVEEVR